MENNQSLTEVYNDFSYQLVSESTGDGSKPKDYIIRGCFSKAGVKNKNGRVYPKSVMKKSVAEAQKLVKEGKFISECEHATNAKINIDRIAAKVVSLDMADDGTVIGEMKILDTDEGRNIKVLIDEGVKLGVSTRGFGTLKKVRWKNEKGIMEDILEVQDNYKLRSIDIVFDPSAGEFGSPDFITEGTNYGKDNSIEGQNTLIKVWSSLFG